MNKLIKLANRFKIMLANSYMYEPEEYEETDQDRDFENYWDYYTGELGVMTDDELWSEQKKLKGEALSYIMDDEEVPRLLMQKLKEVRKYMKLAVDDKSIMKELLSGVSYVE